MPTTALANTYRNEHTCVCLGRLILQGEPVCCSGLSQLVWLCRGTYGSLLMEFPTCNAHFPAGCWNLHLLHGRTLHCSGPDRAPGHCDWKGGKISQNILTIKKRHKPLFFRGITTEVKQDLCSQFHKHAPQITALWTTAFAQVFAESICVAENTKKTAGGAELSTHPKHSWLGCTWAHRPKIRKVSLLSPPLSPQIAAELLKHMRWPPW